MHTSNITILPNKSVQTNAADDYGKLLLAYCPYVDEEQEAVVLKSERTAPRSSAHRRASPSATKHGGEQTREMPMKAENGTAPLLGRT